MGEDYIDQLMASGQGTTMDDIVKMTANEPRFWNPTEYGTTIKDGVVLQPQYESTGPEGETGPVTGVLRYKEGKTAPGQEYEILDPVTGRVTGKGKFQKVGNLGSMLKETAIDLGPLLLTALGMPGAGSLGTMLGTSIAGGLGVTGLSAAQLAALGSAVGGAGLGLAQGQDPLDVLKSAALAGASAFVPSQVSSFLPSTGTPALDAALKKATELGTAAALKGGDVEGAVLGSLAGSGFGAATGATGIDPKLFSTVIDVARSGGDPQKLFNAVVGYAQSAGKGQPSGQAASAGYGGAETGGFFDPEAEDAESYIRSLTNYEAALPQDTATEGAGELLSWMLDPYKRDTAATTSQDDVYEDIESLLARYEDQGFSTAPTGDLDQSVTVTGERERPDWDILPDVITTPRTIRDVGPVTQIKPGEKLEGTDITEPDLAKDLPKVVGGTKTTTTKSGKPATQGGLDLSQLAFLIGMMQHKPKEEEQYQAAQWQPLDRELMYGLRG